MKYEISLECEHGVTDRIFNNLATAKSHYTELLTSHMLSGQRFSIELFSGLTDNYGSFWSHKCIATFEYDGDDSAFWRE